MAEGLEAELAAAQTEAQWLVDAEDWDALCPNASPERCEGWSGVMNWWLRCPAVVTTCPHLAARRMYVRKLFAATLPVYARRPMMEEIVPGLRDGPLGVRRYCETIGKRVLEGAGMTLLGPVGCGKTCALACIGYAAVGHFVGTVLYVDAAVLFGKLHEKDATAYFDAELLLLDDLGKEYAADWGLSGFHLLIEHRRAKGLSTCLTTNLSAARLQEADSVARVIDRFKEVNSTVETRAKSQRRPLREDAWE